MTQLTKCQYWLTCQWFGTSMWKNVILVTPYPVAGLYIHHYMLGQSINRLWASFCTGVLGSLVLTIGIHDTRSKTSQKSTPSSTQSFCITLTKYRRVNKQKKKTQNKTKKLQPAPAKICLIFATLEVGQYLPRNKLQVDNPVSHKPFNGEKKVLELNQNSVYTEQGVLHLK